MPAVRGAADRAGCVVIRFCDLREAYWADPEGTRGPIAFIDTVSDTFVTVDGQALFSDFSDFITCLAADRMKGRVTDAYVDRLCRLVPEALR